MSACERVLYYRRCLEALVPGGAERGDTLARVLEQLIDENLRECRDEGQEEIGNRGGD
jgi:hypothetical protein